MTLRHSFPVLVCSLLVASAGVAAAQATLPGSYPTSPGGSYRDLPGAYRNAPPVQEESPYLPPEPPVVYGTPAAGGHDLSSQPAYANQPRAPEVQPEQQAPAPQPRGLSSIPIFGPLLAPLDNSGPAANQSPANQPPPTQYGARPGEGAQPGSPQPGSGTQGYGRQGGGQQDSVGAVQQMRPPADIAPVPRTTLASLPPEEQPETDPKELPAHLKRQYVDYVTKEPAGTIVIDTPNTYLYLVLGNGKAMRYGIGVGREGFTWAGVERVSRMAEWPDWHPPAEMIERQPYLPRFMAGGDGNPLGARALYLGKSLYRIHGTNQPSTIGTFVSSGCIRLVNEDVADLYSRITVGTRVVVLPGRPASPAAQNLPPAQTIR